MLSFILRIIHQHWRLLCGSALIIFLVNLLYLISQLARPREAQYHPLQRHKLVQGADPTHIIHQLVNSSTDTMFECLDKSKAIKLSEVNDDFCDCPDASDESGTNACNNGRFFCKVEQKYIASFYVNDGICDCCDGADEWKHLEPAFILPVKYPSKKFVPCPNSCGT